MKHRRELIKFRIELLVVFIFLNCIGFPGQYARLFGEIVNTIVNYTSFLLQIGLMLFFSGSSFLEVRLLDLKKKYLPIYQFVFLVAAESMMVTIVPAAELITCLRLMTTVFFATWLTEHFTLKRIIELFCIAQVLLDVFIIILALFFPYIAFSNGDTYFHALRGIYDAKNAMASELAFGFAVMFLNLQNKRVDGEEISYLWFLFAGMQVVLLLMAQAAGAILTDIVVVAAYAFFYIFRRYRLPLGWIYIFTSVGFLFFAFTILPLFGPALELIGKDATLTGRTELWDGIFRFVQQDHMLTGFGYGQFWINKKLVARLHAFFVANTFFGQMSTGSHNQIFELWLNVGLIGLASYFYMLLRSLRNLEDMHWKDYLNVGVLLVYALFCGLTERVFEDAYSYHIVSFFIMASAGCSYVPKRKAVRKKKPLIPVPAPAIPLTVPERKNRL